MQPLGSFISLVQYLLIRDCTLFNIKLFFFHILYKYNQFKAQMCLFIMVKSGLISMNSIRCMVNNNCKTCIDESKCDGLMGKYKNKKVVYKDMKFDSKKEYLRYLVLEDMQRKGEINGLQTQVPFVLVPPFQLNGKKYKGIRYIADFVYKKDGKVIVEDTKGYCTDVYKIKRKLMAYIHKIEIKEVL